MAEAFVKAKAVILQPTPPGQVPNGCLFIDSTNLNITTIKNVSGLLIPVNTSVDGSILIKQVQSGGAIGNMRPVSKMNNGKAIEADSDSASGQAHVGYALEDVSGSNIFFNMLCAGPNLAGAVNGLGFIPGDDVYLNVSGGYTNNPALLNGAVDSFIKVGVADCEAGVASGVAKDLIAYTQVLTRPT